MSRVATERPPEAWAWAIDELRHEWRPLVAYQLIVTVAGALLFTPVLSLLLRRILLRTGSVAVNNFDLLGFFLSPVGIVFLLVLLAGTVALFALLHAGLVLLTAHHDDRGDPLPVLRQVLRDLPRMTLLGLLQLERLLLAALPFVAVLALLALPLLRAHDINYYLHESPPEWRRLLLVGSVLAIGYALLALWLAARWQLAVPFLLLDRRAPRAALASSAEATRGRAWPLVFTLGGWWLTLFTAQFVLAFLLTQVARATLAVAGERTAAVFVVVAAVVGVLALLGFAWLLAGHAGHAALTNRFYRQAGGAVDEARLARAGGRAPLSLGTVGLAAVAAIVATLLGGAWWVDRLQFRDDVAITGHRGTATAPENTLAALREAAAQGADYAEIDVQRTADGAVVLLHDADLMRMAGDPRRIDQVTLPELASVDVGSRKDPRYAAERVPTLAQAIAVARDAGLRLNVELKYNRPDSLLAPAVVQVLRATGYDTASVITSLDLASLQQVKRLAPDLRTGMIVTRAVGDPTRLPVEFLSLNQAQVSTRMLARAHRAGKEVHVWTVNRRPQMEAMVELGVDNIITDHPADAAAMRAERAELTSSQLVTLRLRRLVLE